MRVSGQTRIDAQNPWPGLESFDEGAERFFNGRREETAELRRLVLQEPLTVLFGMSGLGKTSLLQAGLFPAIRKDNVLPVYVRLDVRSREGPLIDQVARALQVEMGRHQVDAPPFEPGESLWGYLHRAGLELWSAQNQLLTPLFVLDQFEEVFTQGADRAEAVAQLRRDVSDLVENRVPAPLAELIRGTDAAGARFFLDGQRYKVLLSFREDFLPPVEGWKLEMPSILRNRLRLLPMSAARAFEAVHDTAPHLVNETLAQQIVDFVAAQDRGSAAASLGGPAELKVEPALLSLVCHGLNEKRKERSQTAFDDALLRETGPSIIADFYARSVRDLSEAAQRFIEEQLITESGFRKQCAVDDARHRHGVTDADLTLLVDRRLLRIEPLRGTDHVELVHDLLTGVVREVRERERRRARQRVQRRRRMQRLVIGVAAVGVVATGFVIRERQEHERTARMNDQRADSIRLRAVRQYNEGLRALNEDLARGKATAETLRTMAVLDARRLQAAQLELDTILKLWTGARVAQARLEEFGRLRTDRATRLAAVPESLRATDKTRLLADSVRADSGTFTVLRGIDSAAGGMVMRGAARAATYLASARLIPFDAYGRHDLFDVSRGARVLGPQGLTTARAMLGDSLPTNPERDLQPAFFGDGQRPGYRHWIEWDAAAPAVGSVAIFAAHDGTNLAVPSASPSRSFRRLTLTTRDRSGEVLDTLVDYLPALPYAGPDAYGDQQPLRSLSVCFRARVRTVRPAARVAGRTRFRLEVVQAAAWGPRVVEVDGYADASCGAPDPTVLARLGTSVRPVELLASHGSSPVTLAMVLTLAEAKTVGRETLAGALEFLARAPAMAWNQALLLRAGNVLRTAPPGRGSPASWTDSLARTLTAMVPGWRGRVAIIVAREMVAREGPRLLSDTALTDAQVRDSLAGLAERLGAPHDSITELRTWLGDLDRLEDMRRRALQVAANRDTVLGARRLVLVDYLSVRSRSSRRGGPDRRAVLRLLDGLSERLMGIWAVCSRTSEGRCRAVEQRAEFAVGDSLLATFAPAPGSRDSSVTVVALRDSAPMARGRALVTPLPMADLKRPEVGPPVPWGIVLQSPGRWTLRIYDSLNRLVFVHAFTVRTGQAAPGGER